MANIKEHTKEQAKAHEKSRPKRLLALDIMRGITIAGMILVNNPGSWSHIYAPLEHAEWHGLTPTDLVFPFFMFIMGVSTYFSLRKYDFRLTGSCLRKIIVRTLVIFGIGLAIAWFGKFLRAIPEKGVWEAACNFDHIRMLGVMPRLALCYGFGSLIALAVGRKTLPWVVFALLAIYSVLLLVGNGLVFSEDNIIARVDLAVLGENHMYHKTIDDVRLAFDPEGLLSTLPSIAHMLIGFLCGGIIISTKDNDKRINKLFIVGTILTFAGLLLSYGMPINKSIWSPTFVLTTCGMASSLLGLLIWIIDIRGWKRWTPFFRDFGVNPLFMYCLGAVMSIILSCIKVPYHATESGVISVSGWYYRAVCIPCAGGDPVLGSLFFAISFVVMIWIPGYFLYKNKIYIKI